MSTDSGDSVDRTSSATERSWDVMFQRMDRYRREHGDCLVPAKYSKDQKLSHWVQTQRSARKRQCLTQDRIDALDSIGFTWSVNQALWDTMFESLVGYKLENGHCMVPQSYPQLGQWVDRQRTDKSEGRIDPDRLKRLQCLGFVWHVGEESWETMFARLQRYKERHGDCLVPQRNLNDPKLGNWVDKQRYLKSTARLQKHREKKLNSIGFNWSVAEESWESMFARLVEYKKRNGDCLVPLDHKEVPKLGRWVKEQRRKRTTLPNQRKAKLLSLDFVWCVSDYHWNNMYEALVEYKQAHGNCLVPNKFEANPQLGNWVHNQRIRKDSATDERREKLEAVGFFLTDEKTPNEDSESPTDTSISPSQLTSAVASRGQDDHASDRKQRKRPYSKSSPHEHVKQMQSGERFGLYCRPSSRATDHVILVDQTLPIQQKLGRPQKLAHQSQKHSLKKRYARFKSSATEHEAQHGSTKLSRSGASTDAQKVLLHRSRRVASPGSVAIECQFGRCIPQEVSSTVSPPIVNHHSLQPLPLVAPPMMYYLPQHGIFAYWEHQHGAATGSNRGLPNHDHPPPSSLPVSTELQLLRQEELEALSYYRNLRSRRIAAGLMRDPHHYSRSRPPLNNERMIGSNTTDPTESNFIYGCIPAPQDHSTAIDDNFGRETDNPAHRTRGETMTQWALPPYPYY